MRAHVGDLLMIGGAALVGVGSLLLGVPGLLVGGGLVVVAVGWAVDQRWG